jgi:hypothetical protein
MDIPLEIHASPDGDIVHYYWSTPRETGRTDLTIVWTRDARALELEISTPGGRLQQFPLAANPVSREQCDAWVTDFTGQEGLELFLSRARNW